MSRIGNQPLELPSGVTAVVDGGEVRINGPKGQLTQRLVDSALSIEIEDGINNLNPEFILNECLDGNVSQCAQVRRGNSGDLWIGSNVNSSGQVIALNDNLAIEEVENPPEVPVSLDHELPIGPGLALAAELLDGNDRLVGRGVGKIEEEPLLPAAVDELKRFSEH